MYSGPRAAYYLIKVELKISRKDNNITVTQLLREFG